MNGLAIAVALHVFSIVLWIGGAGFATLALLPALRSVPDIEQRLALFEAVEARFAWVVRGTILLAGGSGFYMVSRLNAWQWYGQLTTWWMTAMLVVWVVFAALIFVLEPFVLHRHFLARVRANPETAFRQLERLHWLLLIASLITILGAAAGSHGLAFG